MAPSPNVSRLQKVLTGWSGTVLPDRIRGLVAANEVPHPHWLNGLPNWLTLLSKGGVVWIAGVLGARLVGLPRSGDALRVVVPSVLGASLLNQYLLKPLVQQPRPLSARVRAVVLRRHYRSSFPSGDAVGAFAGAWVISRIWPAGAPVFVGGAALLIGMRVYIGAHRWRDVLAGAVLGVVMSEGIWQSATHIWPLKRQ